MIEARNLTFSYGKEKQALHGLDFSVEDGEIFGFLGPNGSGKSTTQKILTGILKGYGGRVSLFGEDMQSGHTQAFFQKIGVLFEKTGILLLKRDAAAHQHGKGPDQQSQTPVS